MRKYIDIIREHEVLAEEVLEEGMLQKLAGLALGAVLALGPKVGQADTIYTYLDPSSNEMKTAFYLSQVPQNANVVMSVDTDTNKVKVIKSKAPDKIKQQIISKDSNQELPKTAKDKLDFIYKNHEIYKSNPTLENLYRYIFGHTGTLEDAYGQYKEYPNYYEDWTNTYLSMITKKPKDTFKDPQASQLIQDLEVQAQQDKAQSEKDKAQNEKDKDDKSKEKQKQLDIYRDKVTKAWQIFQKMVDNPSEPDYSGKFRQSNSYAHRQSKDALFGKYSSDDDLRDARTEMDYNNPFGTLIPVGREIDANVEKAAQEYSSGDPDLSLKVKMREVDNYLAAYQKYEKRMGQLKAAEVKQQQANVKEKQRIEVLKKQAKENPQAFADPMKHVDVDLVSWEKGGFGLVAIATIKLVNDNPYPVSDWEINCIGYAPSGTKIGINRRTTYETVPAFSKKTIYDFNMGFQNEQVKSMACTVRSVRR